MSHPVPILAIAELLGHLPAPDATLCAGCQVPAGLTTGFTGALLSCTQADHSDCKLWLLCSTCTEARFARACPKPGPGVS